MAKEVVDAKKVETFFDKFKKLVADSFGAQKFQEAKLKDGTVIYYDGDMPMEGMEVWVVSSEGGENLPAPDGVHVLEDETQIEVVGGKIVKVVAPAAMEQEKPNASIPETEAAAKRIVESTIKETVYSKQEVEDKVKSLTEDFAAKFEAHKKETAETIATLTTANEALTKQVGKAEAESKAVRDQFAKFSTEAEKIIGEFGSKPQVKPEEKAAEFRAENKKNPAKLSPEEWAKTFMK